MLTGKDLLAILQGFAHPDEVRRGAFGDLHQRERLETTSSFCEA